MRILERTSFSLAGDKSEIFPASHSDVYIQQYLTVSGAAEARGSGCAFLEQDISNHYFARTFPTHVSLYKRVGGVASTLVKIWKTVTDNVEHLLEVEVVVSQKRIIVTFDGEPIIDFTEPVALQWTSGSYIAAHSWGSGTVASGTIEAWTAKKGIMSIDTTPVKGEIFVDGTSWGIAPQEISLDPGTYTVSFGAFSGYSTPQAVQATVTPTETTTVTATYEIPVWSTLVTLLVGIGLLMMVSGTVMKAFRR